MATPIDGYLGKTLFASNLSPTVNETALYDCFSPYGLIDSIHLRRHCQTNVSLGCAYINFNFRENAQNAMDSLNYEKIHGREIQIMWKNRDPSLRKSGEGNIFVKNLPPSTTTRQFRAQMSTYGDIISCKVVYKSEFSACYGFAHFSRPADAEKAITELNTSKVFDRYLFAGNFQTSKERKERGICVENLASSVLQEELRKQCEEYGSIATSSIRKTDTNGCVAGFVEYRDHSSAARAIEDLNGKAVTLGDMTMTVRVRKTTVDESKDNPRCYADRALMLKEKFGDRSLYVLHLPVSYNDINLKKLFSEFGKIGEATVLTTSDDNKVGYVRYTEAEASTRAMDTIRGLDLGSGKSIVIHYAKNYTIEFPKSSTTKSSLPFNGRRTLLHQNRNLLEHKHPILQHYTQWCAPPVYTSEEPQSSYDPASHRSHHLNQQPQVPAIIETSQPTLTPYYHPQIYVPKGFVPLKKTKVRANVRRLQKQHVVQA